MHGGGWTGRVVGGPPQHARGRGAEVGTLTKAAGITRYRGDVAWPSPRLGFHYQCPGPMLEAEGKSAAAVKPPIQ